MSYKVLARKWRPANFDELVGQSHVQKTLSSALKNQRLHHAYLFTGTRGVGKTTIARIMAKCLNCEQGVTNKPCGECASCVEISEGRFVDLIEVDAASKTKVDDTRELLENVQYSPTRGRYKIYLIDEVHMLSKHSFNALLKTLEEPPPHVIFLLATTDPHMLPATVLSRCLQFHLKNMSQQEIKTHLGYILEQEQITFEPPALDAIARSAKGSMRDSLSLLDQAIAYGNGEVKESEVNDMLGSIDRNHVNAILLDLCQGELAEVLRRIEDMDQFAPDYHAVMDEIIQTLHKVALYQQLPDYLDDSLEKQQVQTLADQLDPQDVQLFYQIALTSKRDLYLAPNGRSGLEMSLLRMHSFKPGAISQVGEAGAPVAEKKSQSSSDLTSNKAEPVITTQKSESIKSVLTTSPGTDALPEHLSIPDHVTMVDDGAPEDSAIQLADILGDGHAEPDKQSVTTSQSKPAVQESKAPASDWDINSILRPITAKPAAEEPVPVQAPEEMVTIPEQVTEADEPLVPEPQPETELGLAIEPEPPSFAEVQPGSQPLDVQPAEAQASPASETRAKIQDITDLDTSNWHQVVDELNVAGITEQILLATQVQSVSAQQLVLHLESRLWNMLSAEQLNQISVLLHGLFNSDFTVKIETQQPRAETPGQRRQRLIEERLQAAVDHLEHDPVVISFKNKFGSHLDKRSVEPIN
jgi:DNA polymerase-3 subunit gamma/tau